MDLNKMPKAERAAAMRGGVDGWAQVGSSEHHVRYALPLPSASRRRCGCGCGRRATYRGMANGVCLTTACELAIARWVKTGRRQPRPNEKVRRPAEDT